MSNEHDNTESDTPTNAQEDYRGKLAATPGVLPDLGEIHSTVVDVRRFLGDFRRFLRSWDRPVPDGISENLEALDSRMEEMAARTAGGVGRAQPSLAVRMLRSAIDRMHDQLGYVEEIGEQLSEPSAWPLWDIKPSDCGGIDAQPMNAVENPDAEEGLAGWVSVAEMPDPDTLHQLLRAARRAMLMAVEPVTRAGVSLPAPGVELFHGVIKELAEAEAGLMMDPQTLQAWQCGICGQLNSGWSMPCGRCEFRPHGSAPAAPEYDAIGVAALLSVSAKTLSELLQQHDPQYPSPSDHVHDLMRELLDVAATLNTELHDSLAAAHDALGIPADPEASMPKFTIKGKDALAYPAITEYMRLLQQHGLDAQAGQASHAREEIRRWQAKNIGVTKLPDHEHVPVGRRR